MANELQSVTESAKTQGSGTTTARETPARRAPVASLRTMGFEEGSRALAPEGDVQRRENGRAADGPLGVAAALNAPVQRQEAGDGAPTQASGDSEILAKAEAAVAAGAVDGGEGVAWHWEPKWDRGDPDDNLIMPRELVFSDAAIESMLHHITQKWGCANELKVDPLFDWPQVPKWVEVCRTKAGYVRKGASDEEQRTAAVVKKMCDSVSAMTEGERFREKALAMAEAHTGPGALPVVDQATLDTLPSSFTSCTSFAPMMVGGAQTKDDPKVSDYFGGPNRWMEIAPGASQSLGSAWHGMWASNVVGKGDKPSIPGDRPKAGDMVILKNFAQTEAQHISFFASLTPGTEPGHEHWVCLGGGKEPLDPTTNKRIAAPAAAEDGQFDPATGLLVNAAHPDGIPVLGWIDTAEMFNQAKQKQLEEQARYQALLARQKPGGAAAAR